MDAVGIETIKPISTNKTEIALDSDELKNSSTTQYWMLFEARVIPRGSKLVDYPSLSGINDTYS